MATRKTPAAKAPAKKPATKVAAIPTTKKAAKPAAKVTAELKPIKEGFTKAGFAAHLATQTEIELKTVKKVLAALEAAALGSLHKKGLGEFTLPGLLKIVAQKIPAKAKRFGKNPFTGQEQWFPAKPASVRVKIRPLKKLKDAPL